MNNKDVSAESDKGIPKLRFPEFLGQPLHNVQLGDVTEEASARNGGKLAAASVMGVRKEGGIVPMEERLVAGDISRYKLVRSNWFAYNPMRLNIGSIARWQGGGEILVSPDYVVFRCSVGAEPTALIPEYLDHFRSSRQWEAFTNESGDGGVRIRIYYRDLARMRLLLPGASEQQKIADCLSSIDALLAAEADKLEALKNHKKGLMQRLFPRPERIENGVKLPAEVKPRFRFPEFSGAGDWQEKTIGGSTKSFSGGTPSTSDPSLYGGEIPFIRSAEIDKSATELALTRKGLNSSSSKMVGVGDILIAMYGANSGNAAISRLSGAINQAVLCLRHESSNAFLYQYWCSRQEWVTERYLQGGQGNLSAEIIKSVPIPTPSVAEQTKIGDFLCGLDLAIVGQLERVRALKHHKNGLMQKLLPVTDQVST